MYATISATAHYRTSKQESSMRYWLMKSEPDDVSIDDLQARPGQTVRLHWSRPRRPFEGDG